MYMYVCIHIYIYICNTCVYIGPHERDQRHALLGEGAPVDQSERDANII